MKNFWQTLPKPIIVLAPMAGYTNSAFRLICKKLGADVVYSEMISVDAICHHNQKTLKMLKFNKKESPLVFQLFGNDPKKFKTALSIIEKKLKYKKNIGIDINFGCPAHKVTKAGSGAALMDEMDKAYNIIKTTCENTNLPVSIKIRTRIKNTTAIDFTKKIKNLPFSSIIIHGRTLKQGFTGKIDFETIKQIKQLLPDKIILANGNINNVEDANKTLKLTGADGIGIARGTWGNPWIFQSIKQENEKTKKQSPADDNSRNKTIIKHAKLFLKNNDNLIPIRKHLIHYFKGQPNASHIRRKLIKVETLKDLKTILNKSLIP